MNVDVEYFGEIELDDPEKGDLLDEISLYFDNRSEQPVGSLVAIQID